MSVSLLEPRPATDPATEARATTPPRERPAWTVVGLASRLGRKTLLPFELAGREGVLFRGEDGAAVALDRRCPHLGADLASGVVERGAIVCPLHHWHWRADGRRRLDGDVAGSACAETWAVAERHGLLFAFSDPATPGPRPLPPSLDRHAGERLVWSRPFSMHLGCDWQCSMANAFDLEHLATVHHRRLVGEARYGRLDGDRFRLEYTTRSVGRGLSDRAMRILSGGSIEVVITNFGGPTVVVESRTGRSRTAAVVGLRPEGDGARVVATFGIAARGPFAPAQAELARWLFLAFLKRDLGALVGMRRRASYPLLREPCLRAFLDFLDRPPDSR